MEKRTLHLSDILKYKWKITSLKKSTGEYLCNEGVKGRNISACNMELSK